MPKGQKSQELEIRNNVVKLGDTSLPLIDPAGIQAVGADVITEARVLSNEMVSIGFGTVMGTFDGPSHVMVCSRLRMSRGTASALRNLLGRLLDVPVSKSPAH